MVVAFFFGGGVEIVVLEFALRLAARLGLACGAGILAEACLTNASVLDWKQVMVLLGSSCWVEEERRQLGGGEWVLHEKKVSLRVEQSQSSVQIHFFSRRRAALHIQKNSSVGPFCNAIDDPLDLGSPMAGKRVCWDCNVKADVTDKQHYSEQVAGLASLSARGSASCSGVKCPVSRALPAEQQWRGQGMLFAVLISAHTHSARGTLAWLRTRPLAAVNFPHHGSVHSG